MTVKKRDTRNTWVDPDDAPELTDGFFSTARRFIGEKEGAEAEFKVAVQQALRGRPAGTSTKTSTTIRFDNDVLAAFKASGKGWQSRMNSALREWLKENNP